MSDKLDIQKVTFKIWRFTSDSSAYMTVADKIIQIVAGGSCLIVGEEEGVIVGGRVGFGGTPGDIQFGGLWKMNDMHCSTLPSTIMTPISLLTFAIPGAKLCKQVSKDLLDFMMAMPF